MQRVIDGDTQQFILDLGFGISKKITVRLLGCDTPESRTKNKLEKKAGKLVTAYVKSIYSLYSADGMQILSKDCPDKFGGRSLGDIVFGSDISLTDILLKRGFARPYYGKKKEQWSDEELATIVCALGEQ